MTTAINHAANRLLDYLAFCGYGEAWLPLADIADVAAILNVRRERRFALRLVRNLIRRGLAETRRGRRGAEIRLTPAGVAMAVERQRRADEAWREFPTAD